MIQVKVHLRSYIAHPYWPERAKVIDIQKQSGMNRARSDANRRKALEEHLGRLGMTLTDYETLVAAADRQWHVTDTGNVVVPQTSVAGMVVATCDTIRAAGRPVKPEQVRTAIRMSRWETTIPASSAGTWERFAVVTSGTGQKLSNQRAFRTNEFVGAEPPAEVEPTEKVFATGTFDVNPDMVEPDVLHNALKWAGVNVGVGASRKMGWGRFEILEWDESS